jgi:hypothetical protein
LASTSSTPSERRPAIRDGIDSLTLINRGSVIAAGDATAATWIRCALNFVVPFLVSNAGLLSGRSGGADRRVP